MHSCPECHMACNCDMEDHEQDAPDDCTHCEGDFEDGFGDGDFMDQNTAEEEQIAMRKLHR